MSEKQKFLQETKPLETVLITKILIRGYCDDVGTMGHSDSLSEKRAFQVEHFLLKEGIPCDSAPVVKGMGEIPLNPSSSKNIEEQRANNRRVEIEITKTGEK
ncbi:MAG: OmpA family protein [Bacteroidales bacterium]|nr:OmpA family protein [Bacteroidales bacterium]MCF8455544.1 OmpA family protein [Bacteroidales bacterium]